MACLALLDCDLSTHFRQVRDKIDRKVRKNEIGFIVRVDIVRVCVFKFVL